MSTVEKPKKASRWIRRSVQILFFVLAGLIASGHALTDAGISIPFLGSASLHAVCPFGGVVSWYQFFTEGTFIQKIHSSAFILSMIAVILLVFFGPVFCGWMCPMGSIQEWVGKLGKKIFGKRYNAFVPAKLDTVLRYARYIVLARVLQVTITTGKLMFQEVDPYYALFQFWTGEVAITAFVVLGASLVLSLFVERPFCKYACPYGAFQGVFNLFRIFGIKRKASTCIDCKLCDRSCPMNIKVSQSGTVRNHQCISCLECTSEYSCPVEHTVTLAAGSVNGGKK